MGEDCSETLFLGYVWTGCRKKSTIRSQEVYNKVDRLLTGLTAQQKGISARWYSIKTSLVLIKVNLICHKKC